LHLLNSLEGRHLGIESLQFFDSFGRDLLALMTTAAGTDISDDAHIAADRIAVNRVIDGAVADTEVVHAADNGLKGLHIPGSVTVQLHIGDVTCIAQGMVGGFQPDLVVNGDGEPDGDVERVGVVFGQ